MLVITTHRIMDMVAAGFVRDGRTDPWGIRRGIAVQASNEGIVSREACWS
jgi:hypothetical protein